MVGGRWQVAGDVPADWLLDELLTETHERLTQRDISITTFCRLHELSRGASLAGETLVYNGHEICQRDEIKLRGDHNVSNLLAACAIAGALDDKLGATVEAMGDGRALVCGRAAPVGNRAAK